MPRCDAGDRVRPALLGVLNVTPDSFSDGGQHADPGAALQRARTLWEQGADWVDVGAQSTRPGAADVSVDEELRRLQPVFAGLRHVTGCWSIDTQKPAVMRAALDAGAGMLNDVHALQAPGALDVAAAAGVPVVLMHRRGDPRTMQKAPAYADVVAEVIAFLTERKAACLAAGVAAQHIICDPGIGFGKTLADNLALLRALPEMRQRLECRLLVGVSRKSMFRDLLALDDPAQRVIPSVLTAVWCAQHGADFLRVHDVRETCDALTLWATLQSATTAQRPAPQETV